MSKCVIKKKAKTDNIYIVTFEVTKGQMLAIRNGMEYYSNLSPVGADVFEYTKNAFVQANIED